MSRQHPMVMLETDLRYLDGLFRATKASFVPVCNAEGQLIGSYHAADLRLGQWAITPISKDGTCDLTHEVAVVAPHERVDAVATKCTGPQPRGAIVVDEDYRVLGVVDLDQAERIEHAYQQRRAHAALGMREFSDTARRH